MSRRLDINRHLHSLGDIREIMNAMKTLAQMETRKLGGFLDAQHRAVESMEEVARDFRHFFPDLVPEADAEASVYLLIGTERGFCGPVNQDLLESFNQRVERSPPPVPPRLIVVGRKLHALLEDNPWVEAFIAGASISEDISPILARLAIELGSLQQRHGSLTLQGLYHEPGGGTVVKKLLPFFQSPAGKEPGFSYPPLLHLTPVQFLLEFSEQYLFASLHEMLYTSLMAENHRRIAHLEGAVRHLDEESRELSLRSNILRQEEITEEIEVILLSASSLAGVESRIRKKEAGIEACTGRGNG